ncbi:ATP-binding cassette domain-containing protein [Nocardia rhamnosiphila]|nr:ATP-binding cassette domain-containing protein [Nocardia rhamnosiphila]
MAVLEDFSLTVHRGEFVSLVGPSGCGKSTILNLIAGFAHPTHGTVRAGGRPVTHPGPATGGGGPTVLIASSRSGAWTARSCACGRHLRGFPSLRRTATTPPGADAVGWRRTGRCCSGVLCHTVLGRGGCPYARRHPTFGSAGRNSAASIRVHP